MLSASRASTCSPHCRFDRQYTRQCIEPALLHYKGPVRCLPGVPGKKSRHYAVSARTLPKKYPPGFQHTCELGDHASIVRRTVKESERREEVYNSVEPARPSRGELAHVSSRVVKRRAFATLLRESNQVARVIDAVDDEAGFSEQM